MTTRDLTSVTLHPDGALSFLGQRTDQTESDFRTEVARYATMIGGQYTVIPSDHPVLDEHNPYLDTVLPLFVSMAHRTREARHALRHAVDVKSYRQRLAVRPLP